MKARCGWIQTCFITAIDDAIAYGLRRAFKYREDSLTDEQTTAIREAVGDAVSNLIYEVIDFEDEEQNQ